MHPKKRFGQHFLRDKNIIQRIIQVIKPQPTDHIVEIGPGLGALTTELLPIVGKMDAVEIDRDLVIKLQAVCSKLGELHIHQMDVLDFLFVELTQKKHSLRVVGNLPYNISTPLIFHLLNEIDCIYDMHFLIQKEVADRIAAQSGSKKYGRLSVMVQYFCQAESLFTVAPESFYPAPKIQSTVIRLTPHAKIALPAKNKELFAQIVKQGFNQRRKTIHNSLKSLISTEQLAALNIDTNARAEQLTINDFVRIANLLVNPNCV